MSVEKGINRATNHHGKQKIHLSFRHCLTYKYVGKQRRRLSKEEQVFLINDISVPHEFHPSTISGKRKDSGKNARPRVQLTEDHATQLQLPVIDERSRDITEVVFPNGSVNYVLLARRTSKCAALRSLHGYMNTNGPVLEQFLSKVDKKHLVKDEVGGGHYIVSGFGNMGKNVSETIRPRNQPALRKSLLLAQHHTLAQIVGGMFSQVAECIAKHCDEVFTENQQFMKEHHRLAWPPIEYQNHKWSWMSSQFIVRHWGTPLSKPITNELCAAHTDSGDHDCTMFSLYRTGGGERGLGGAVAGSDLAIFEHASGGPGFRVKTCIEDTVVIVVSNSHRQLHGCIKSRDGFAGDDLAWTTRIIPYIPKGVYHWMTSHPGGRPFMDIP